jgi:hypothetical protein
MRNFKLIVVLLFICTSALFSQKNATQKSLFKVVETFKKAITKEANQKEFYNLFLHDSITWATVLEGKTKKVLKKKADYKPFRSMTFKQFYGFVSKNNCEEKFYNVNIADDNKYATISFDYSFSKDGKVLNWGKEYWNLLKVENEWKITSVLWTTNFQNIEKCPFENNSYYKQ